jgi:hypothetical protein
VDARQSADCQSSPRLLRRTLADTRPAMQLFWLAWGGGKVDVQQILDAWR